MKLRYWYKIDHKKQPIPGSNVRRKSRPGASHQWKEILDPCCNPNNIDCTCGPRYFIQLDGKGKPVDGTLIKRVFQPKNNFPEGTDGNRLYEINWKSVCCNEINWNFIVSSGTTGTMTITVNGNTIVNSVMDSEGSFKPNQGDTIEVTVTMTSGTTEGAILTITGGETFTDTNATSVVHSFIWNNQNVLISGSIANFG